MFYKTSTGAEAGPFNVGMGTIERQGWVAWTVHDDNGFDVTGTNVSGTGSTAASVPSLTTTQDDDLFIGVVATDVSAGLTTPMTPATMTKLAEAAASSAAAVAVFFETAATAGSWPSNTGVTLNVAEQWLGVSFAIKGVVATGITRPIHPIMSRQVPISQLRI